MNMEDDVWVHIDPYVVQTLAGKPFPTNLCQHDFVDLSIHVRDLLVMSGCFCMTNAVKSRINHTCKQQQKC